MPFSLVKAVTYFYTFFFTNGKIILLINLFLGVKVGKHFREKGERRESSREETKYIKELRKEIQKLKRENAQMRKRNSRLENDFLEAEAEQSQESKKPTRAPKKEFECPKCEAKEVSFLELRGVLYYKCCDCGSKGRVEE